MRETVNITCLNLRAKEQGSIREALFNKLFNLYRFNFDAVDEQSVQMKKGVKHNALRMMTKALNTWRNMANSKRHEDFESYIKKRWPQIQENDWQRFVASHADSVFKTHSKWGKDMRKNKLDHKEDKFTTPLSYVKAGRQRVYSRSPDKYDPLRETLIFKSGEVAQVKEKLVSS